ncbi:H-NS histone family protein [Mycetohabitans sp. B8]|uniref:H-NS histone family protein n=1 Tax=Mycetohabitans sp. B8 TaxID=2841845 RepID=UPI001F1A7D1A|nr:H-NS histone family protein [Mycetohabitans sp. B8]MCG1042929.1 H-NS histone family protein [Mycetohabitans sp. B8]
MATYKQLQQQIEALQQKAEEARVAELDAVLADIRAKVAEYGLTSQDIFGRRHATSSAQEKRDGVTAKYRDPASGATWSGRGRAPVWIHGKKRERFLIKE